mmetsp:Transcript_24437/g.68087  ORF Transcript_24437/g.68087 Transcript_24437/m.68087 type:complete len:257 (-) Transcript_24437:126-896(-)
MNQAEPQREPLAWSRWPDTKEYPRDMCMEMDISEHASDATNDTAMTTSLLKVNDGNAQEWAKFRQKFESMMAAKGATTAAQRIMHLNTLLKEGGYVATPNHGAGILAAGALFFLHAANAWQRVGKSPAWLPRLSLMPRPNAAASIESESMDISDMACPYDDGSQPPDLDGCSHNQPFHASSSSHLETKANTNANSSSSSSSSNNNNNNNNWMQRDMPTDINKKRKQYEDCGPSTTNKRCRLEWTNQPSPSSNGLIK